jgi:hypothetical protein
MSSIARSLLREPTRAEALGIGSEEGVGSGATGSIHASMAARGMRMRRWPRGLTAARSPRWIASRIVRVHSPVSAAAACTVR